MADKRRIWRDKLRGDCFPQNPPKKSKVQILQQDIYRKIDGKLVLMRSLDNMNNNEDGEPDELKSTSDNQDIVRTPDHRPKDVLENLTPTFRIPKDYLEATAEFFKEISPKLNESQDKDDINIDVIQGCITSDTNNFNFEHCIDNREQEIISNKNRETISLNTCDDSNIALNVFTAEVCVESKKSSENKNATLDWQLSNKEENFEKDFKDNNHNKLPANKTNGAILNDANADKIKSFINSESAQTVTKINKGKNYRKSTTPAPTGKIMKKESICRRSRRKLNFNKSYLDFVAEDDPDIMLLNEAFPSEESNVELSEETASSSDSECNYSKKGT